MGHLADKKEKPPVKRRTLFKWAKKVTLWSITLFFVTAFLLAVSSLLLYFWISTGDSAKKTATLIEKVTGTKTSITQLSADPNGVLSIGPASFELSDDTYGAFESFDIDIDLPLLFAGKIKARSISLKNPTIVIGKKFLGSDEKSAKASSGQLIPSIPQFPLPVELEKLSVEGLRVEINQSSGERIKISGVELFIKSKIDKDDARVEASLSWSKSDGNIEITSGEFLARINPTGETMIDLDGSGSFKLGADSTYILSKVEGVPDAERLIGLPIGIKLNGAGKIAPKFTGLANGAITVSEKSLLTFNANLEETRETFDYRANINDIDVDLDQLAKIADVPDIKIEGNAHVAMVEVIGEIKKSGGVVANVAGDGKVLIKRFSNKVVSLPSGGNADFSFDQVTYDGKSIAGTITAKLKAKSIKEKSIAANGALANVTAVISSETTKPIVTLDSDWSIASIVFDGYDFGAFSGVVKTTGDFVTGDLSDIEATTKANKGATLKVEGNVQKFGMASLSLVVDAKAPVDIWSDYDPISALPIATDDGAISTHINIDGSIGEKYSKPDLAFDLSVDGKNISGELKNAGGTLGKSKIVAKMKGHLGDQWKLYDVEGDGVANLSGASFAKTADIGETKIEFSASSADPMSGSTTMDATFRAKKLTPFDKKLRSLPISAQMTFVADAKSKTTELRDARADLGDFGSFSAPFAKIDKTGRLTGSVKAEKLDIGFLFAMAPLNIREKVGVTSAGGRLSLEINGEASSDFKGAWYPFPFSLDGKIELTEGSLKSPERGIETDGADLSISLFAKGPSARIIGEGSIDRLVATQLFGEREIDPTLDFDISAKPGGAIVIDYLVIDTPSLGFIESLEGNINGLPLEEIDKWVDRPAALLKVVDADLFNYLHLFLDERQKFLAATDIDGEASIETNIKLEKGELIAVDGVTDLSGVTVLQDGKTLVENATGKIPYEKSLRFVGKGEAKEKVKTLETATTIRDTSFFEDIRATSGKSRDEVSVDVISAGPVRLSNNTFDIHMSGRRFGVDYFRTDLLDGGLTGSFAIRGEGEEYLLRTSLVFAGLDVEKALEKDLGLEKKEAGLDGTTTIEVRLKEGGDINTLDIANIDLAIYLTRIDAKALTKLLLFLDPEESSPAIMNARIALKFAKPKKVELLARHGALSLTIDLVYSPLLGGQSVRMPVIKRAPINSLTRFGKIREAVNRVALLNQVMLAVGATRIIVDDKGGVALK